MSTTQFAVFLTLSVEIAKRKLYLAVTKQFGFIFSKHAFRICEYQLQPYPDRKSKQDSSRIINADLKIL
jgi:hypothetical protein